MAELTEQQIENVAANCFRLICPTLVGKGFEWRLVPYSERQVYLSLARALASALALPETEIGPHGLHDKIMIDGVAWSAHIAAVEAITGGRE